VPHSSNESERLTRKKRIDPKLKALGWKVVPHEENADLSSYSRHAIEEFPTANGPADYALVVDSQFLGVIEAKKISLGPQGVLLQADKGNELEDYLVVFTSVRETTYKDSAGKTVQVLKSGACR
jgi:type I site-specific restriction endonuclease